MNHEPTTTFIVTVDGRRQAERPTREEADRLATQWRASGRSVEVMTNTQYEIQSAILVRPQPKGVRIDGWDI